LRAPAAHGPWLRESGFIQRIEQPAGLRVDKLMDAADAFTVARLWFASARCNSVLSTRGKTPFFPRRPGARFRPLSPVTNEIS
jgi:hypothetical protein